MLACVIQAIAGALQVDGETLADANREVLREELGLWKVGHLDKLLKGIDKLDQHGPRSSIDDHSSAHRPLAELLPSAPISPRVSQITNTSVPMSPLTTNEEDLQAIRSKLSEALSELEAIGQVVENLPQNFCCPITQEIMQDPVTTACGSTYDRTAIVEWLQQNMTGVRFESRWKANLRVLLM